MTKYFLVGLLMACLTSVSAQKMKVIGTVTDSSNAPLEMANVISLVAADSSMSSYAFSSHDGRFQLTFPAVADYILRVSYIGFQSQDVLVKAKAGEARVSIKLIPLASTLGEVQIIEEMPISISGDTISYTADAFTDGDEKKLEDVIEKLPGFEINEDGEVEVNGKKVEKVMVEGKDFFDGDSKLATKNIPASAVDKVQVLRDYNEVSPMQGVGTDDNIAINIKLKEGQKSMVFGDITAEGGLDERYLLHPNIFFYSPKLSINFIGDINNIGEPAFTFRDYYRFAGGFKDLNRKSGSGLRIGQDNFSGGIFGNNRAVEVESKMGAFNFSLNPSKKWSISGFVIGSETKTQTLSQTSRTYQADAPINLDEELETQKLENTQSGLFKLSSKYTPNTKLHVAYDVLAKVSKSSEEGNSVSMFSIDTNDIGNISSEQPTEVKQNLEFFYEINDKNIFSVESQFLHKVQNPRYSLTMNQEPFAGYFPVIDTSLYNLLQNKEVRTNKWDAVVNHYWVYNNTNHLNFSAGASGSRQSLNSRVNQLFNGEQLQSFTADSLQNDVDFSLSDYFVGVHYKMKFGKLIMNPGFNAHWYQIKDEQLGRTNSETKNYVLPDFFARYEFRKTKSLTFNYSMQTDFTDINNIIEGVVINNYNSLFTGNGAIDNALLHTFSLGYFSVNMFNFTNVFAGVNYSRKIDDITNSVLNQGLSRVSTPTNSDGINEVWAGYLSVRKTFKKWRIRASTNQSYAIVNNEVDQVKNTNNSWTQNYSASVRTRFKKAPNVELGYRLTLSDYQGAGVASKFTTNNPYVKVEGRLLKYFTIEADYTFTDYQGKSNGTSSQYDFVNAALFYQWDKDSKWELSIRGTNLLDTEFVRQDNFSNFLVSTTQTYVLPRYFMLGVKYDL